MIFALLKYAVVFFPVHQKMIDFLILLCFNGGLIADSVIIKKQWGMLQLTKMQRILL